MWYSGIFSFIVLIGLYTSGTQAGVTCHTNHPLSDSSVAVHSEIEGILSSPIGELCKKDINPGQNDTITQKVNDLLFKVSRHGTAQGSQACTLAFATIVSECIDGQKVAGGDIKGPDGLLYTVSYSSAEHDEEHSHVQTRIEQDIAANGYGFEDSTRPIGRNSRIGGRSPKGKKPKTKPAPKPNPPKLNTPKQKPTPAKQSPKPPKQTPKHSPTPSPKAEKTKTCKQLYALALAKSKNTALAGQKREVPVLRKGFNNSTVHLDKRTTKDAKGCGITIKALDYPARKNMPKTSKYYGFTQPETCDLYAISPSKTPQISDAEGYHVEHILEWQLVTHFFDWVNDKRIRSTRFDNPDPNDANQKLDFCGYWKATWTGDDLEPFSINGSPKRRPLEHLKYAYPGKVIYKDEFVMLEATINTPTKTNMWANSPELKKPKIGIYDADKTTRMIVGKKKGRGRKITVVKEIDDAREVLLDLKFLVGARKYMRNPDIASIFKRQKERIGLMLNQLDREMVHHPRHSTTNKALGAWKPQQLQKFWDEYMDEAFNIAHQRTDHDMDTYLALLEKEWAAGPTKSDPDEKQLQDQIKKLKHEWTTEKKIKWTAPWKTLGNKMNG